jgi:hypothetical protein
MGSDVISNAKTQRRNDAEISLRLWAFASLRFFGPSVLP